MSERINVEQAFDPEARKAQTELNAYMDSRPYEDDRGNIHNPDNGSFVNADTYFDGQRENFEADTMPEAYENMSLSQLAKKLASAEFENDTTKVEDISDALAEKLSAEESRIASDRDAEHSKDRSENLWNRVMGIKDKELSRLSGDSGKKPVILEDDLFTYDSQEELDNKDEAIAEKAAESKAVSDDEVFDNVEAESEDSPEKKAELETIGDILDKIAQRRFNGDWDEEDELADWDKIARLQARAINNELDKRGITDPEERRKQFEGYMNASQAEVEKALDEANRKLREEDGLQEDLDSIRDLDDNSDVVSADEDEQTRVVPEQPEKKRTRARRKVAAWAVAAASLLGIGGYAAGRAHENHIIKSHDTPSVDAINKAQDKMRNLSERAQEDIVRNYEQAERFFTAMQTEEGREGFERMIQAVEDEEKSLEEKYGSAMSPKARKDAAVKRVTANIAAYAAAEAEKQAAQKQFKERAYGWCLDTGYIEYPVFTLTPERISL